MYCKNCGKFLSTDAKFCSECGTKVEVEAPKPKAPEPMFFTRESEPEVKPEKPKKVVHLDEFNWDLEGYPTTPKKTEDVDFNWASVLEEKARVSSPKVSQPKKEETVEEPKVTVDELVDALPEDTEEVEIKEEVASEEGQALEEEIFENLDKDAIEEPTKLIDKSQMKVAGVDNFYTFQQKKAELQELLDQEYARIQNGEIDEDLDLDAEPAPLPDFLQPDTTVTEEPVADEVAESVVEVEEPAAEEPAPVEEPEAADPELVAVVWATAPAGVVVETVAKTVAEAKEVEEAASAESEEVAEDIATAETEKTEEKTEEKPAEEACPSKGEEEPHKLTFDDIFRDDDEDDDEKKEKGGCLKVIAILLCILVVIELGILGVQYFAPNSQAAGYVDQAYQYVVNLINGADEVENQEEVSGPSEIEQIITKQMTKNKNIVSVAENSQLYFAEGEDYGYEEFADTYAFQNSPWYDSEEGESISFGDEIIGTLIQYYSALADKMNDVNDDVFDFVDNTSALYEELETIEGAADLNYVINNLEIGEIRTGAKGFYVLTRVNTVDAQHSEGETEMQVVYLVPNTSKNEMKLVEIQKI